MKQTFTLEGEAFGAAERTAVFRDGDLRPPFGLGFFCPACCRLWAACPVEGRRSFVLSRECPRHQTSFFGPAGSLWDSQDPDFCRALPAALLQRELELHLCWLEQGDLHVQQNAA